MLPFRSLFPCLMVLNLLFFGCNPWKAAEWQRAGEPGKWFVEVPAFLVEDSSLNDNAVLTLAAPDKHFFVVVRKDSFQNLTRRHPDFLLEDFLDLSIERIIDHLDSPDVPEADAARIAGLPAHLATITGRFKNQGVIYRIAVVQGEEFLYQILTWIPSEEERELRVFMDLVIDSFREE